MSESPNAVFLSYASQDTGAANKICDALRTAGVEVWFDQNELVGGDAWDQKIRRQIKECALFVPIVSAATQARREGYFRLEWKLADDRTHLMARGTPFLVPVCIDDTKDWDAIVPDSFMSVQWTRLPGGETPPKFCARVKQLLSGEAMPLGTGRLRPVERGGGAAPPARSVEKKMPIWPLALGACLVLGVGLFFALRSNNASAPPAASQAAAAPAVVRASAARVWPRDPELKRAIALIDGLEATLEDFRLADEISARALERAPSAPEAVTVRARVHSAFVTRNFDFSKERALQAKRFGERAVQLAPDEPQALYALSVFLHDRAGDDARAEALARRACELAPNDPRFWRQLFRIVTVLRPDEGVAIGEDTVRRFPQDVLAHYELSLTYRNRREWAKFERENDATLALYPLANAVNWKARAAGLLHGDLPEMRRWLDQVSARVRFEERTVISNIFYAALSGDYEFGLKSLQGFAEPWFFDPANYAGPAALPRAMLLAQQGKSGLARAQYELAQADMERHKKENPSDETSRKAEVWILLGLERRDEARALFRTYLESFSRPVRVFAMSGWWTDMIPLGLLLGERETAVQLIREGTAQPEGRKTIRHRMQADARMAPFRDDPEIVALLAEPEKQKTENGGQTTEGKPAIDAKSVAVLAFANLSDDKGNEYFSDGISEELLNVLAKVPKLKVAARTSSFHFKGQNVPIPEIAQKLGVAYVVEGSVRKAGNKVRITAQLIKAADGFHVWSETYDRDLTDIFAVQDEIAKNILGIVKGSLLGEAELPHSVTTKPEAYALFLQAQGQLATRGEFAMLEAERLFVAALAIDPDYVPALVGLARTRYLLPSYVTMVGAKARLVGEQAKQAAQHALELDPRNAGALAVHGSVLSMSEWRWAEGEAELLEARKLAPNDAWVANLTGDYFIFTCNVPAALAAKRKWQELDPLSAVTYWDLGFANIVARDYDQAVLWGERAMKLAPTLLSPYVVSALAAGRGGKFDLMRRTLATARRDAREADNDRLLFEAYGAILEKQPDEAHRIMALVKPLVEKGEVAPAFFGYCYLLLGDSDQALTWLQRGYELHDSQLTWSMFIDFADIAANPKTRPLLDQAGLKELYEIRQRNARAGLNKL